jgi:hypothetical protein
MIQLPSALVAEDPSKSEAPYHAPEIAFEDPSNCPEIESEIERGKKGGKATEVTQVGLCEFREHRTSQGYRGNTGWLV